MNWTDQQFELAKIEVKYIPAIQSIVSGMYKEALTMVRVYGLETATGKVLDMDIPTELIPIMVKMYTDGGVKFARITYRETLRKYPLRAMMKKGGLMGISASWLASVKNELSKFALEFVYDITRTIKDEIIVIFNRALEEGWSYDVIVRELLYSGTAIPRANKRARTIARTEVHTGAMFGALKGAESLPYVAQKGWLSGADNRVRRVPRDKFDHRELNGQVRDLDEPFVNEEEIMYPGDVKVSAGNRINCRCVLNFIPKLVNGKPIIK